MTIRKSFLVMIWNTADFLYFSTYWSHLCSFSPYRTSLVCHVAAFMYTSVTTSWLTILCILPCSVAYEVWACFPSHGVTSVFMSSDVHGCYIQTPLFWLSRHGDSLPASSSLLRIESRVITTHSVQLNKHYCFALASEGGNCQPARQDLYSAFRWFRPPTDPTGNWCSPLL